MGSVEVTARAQRTTIRKKRKCLQGSSVFSWFSNCPTACSLEQQELRVRVTTSVPASPAASVSGLICSSSALARVAPTLSRADVSRAGISSVTLEMLSGAATTAKPVNALNARTTRTAEDAMSVVTMANVVEATIGANKPLQPLHDNKIFFYDFFLMPIFVIYMMNQLN